MEYIFFAILAFYGIGIIIKSGIRDKVSLAHLLFLALLVTDLNIRTRNAIDESLDLQIIAKIFVSVLLIGVSIINYEYIYVKLQKKPLIYIVSFALTCLLSASYSPNYLYTIAISLIYLSMCFYCALVSDILNFKDYVRVATMSLLSFIIVSWVVYVFIPDVGITVDSFENSTLKRIKGVSSHPNGLGVISTVLFIHNIYFDKVFSRIRFNKEIQYLIYMLCIITIFFTRSRTAMALVIFIVLYINYRKNPLLISLSGLILMIIMIVSIGNYEHITQLFSRDGDMTDITTASGRVTIWSFVIKNIMTSPFLGSGYGSGKYMINNSFNSDVETSHAHNMILQSLLSVGFFGTLFLVIALLFQIRLIFISPFLFRDLITCVVLILGIFESSIVNPNLITFVWIISNTIKPAIFYPTRTNSVFNITSSNKLISSLSLTKQKQVD